MNKLISVVAATILMFSSVSLRAQSISDLLSGTSVTDVITSVTGGTTVTSSSIVGEWDYSAPAVELTSDSILSSAAGTVVASQLESKLEDLYTKVGIKSGAFSFVFSSDLTFTSDIGSKSLGGTYTVDESAGQVTLNYGVLNSITIGKLTADVTLTSSSLSLLFSADKLLDLVSAVASVSSNDSLALVSSLVDQYDGVKLGFELSGEAATTTTDTSSAIEAAASAISKWF